MNKFNNETLTVLFEDLKNDVSEGFKEMKTEIKSVKDDISILSKSQTMLGGAYNEIRDDCLKRWERFEELEEKIKMEKKLKHNTLLYWIYQNSHLIKVVIPWILIIAISIFAIITNNPELIRSIITKI